MWRGVVNGCPQRFRRRDARRRESRNNSDQRTPLQTRTAFSLVGNARVAGLVDSSLPCISFFLCFLRIFSSKVLVRGYWIFWKRNSGITGQSYRRWIWIPKFLVLSCWALEFLWFERFFIQVESLPQQTCFHFRKIFRSEWQNEWWWLREALWRMLVNSRIVVGRSFWKHSDFLSFEACVLLI